MLPWLIRPARRPGAGRLAPSSAITTSAELAALLEHVREGFARLDAFELDAFELDELIHRYKRSARELWKFCNLNRSETVAWMLEAEQQRGEAIDWWAADEPRQR